MPIKFDTLKRIDGIKEAYSDVYVKEEEANEAISRAIAHGFRLGIITGILGSVVSFSVWLMFYGDCGLI